MTVDGPDERLDLTPDTYRLTQEALHNCVEHAGAAHVHVRIGRADDNPRTLLVEVTEDGVGFDPEAAAPGRGWCRCASAERLGGQLRVAPGPAAGTSVRLVAPRVLGGTG